MNIVVHVHDGVAKHGYEMGTRQAWKCGDKAHEVYRVLGVIKGQVVSVIEDVTAELSTFENNPEHHSGSDGRYIFLGGKCWNEKEIFAPDMPKFMFKKIKGLNQGHRYLSDAELEASLS
ncbi:TPA: acyl-CoA synthetase [Vibrio parahaemolyticus]|nr:acyl-CoA synthetase [Vibrio parahaemolyticus]HCG9204680.1 acyl-CoA synthetase [Vibrio parahaemolyticus]